MNESTVRGRIRTLLDETDVSIYSLAKKFETNQTTLTNQINGETTISLPTLELILAYFPTLSAEYLMRGVGDKYLADDKQPLSSASPVGYINSPGAHHNNNTVIDSPGALAVGSSAEQEQKLEELQAKLEERDNTITERDARIRALEADLAQVRSENSKLVEANYKLIMGK